MPQLSATRALSRPGVCLWLGLSLYLMVNAISQGLVSATADQDQAGELIRSQHWALGYGAQPPLYTYLVLVLFKITGPALWPLLTLKVILLSLLVAAVIHTSQILEFRRDQQLLTLCGIALIPQLIWESQRDLTHSVLATTVAALTLLQLLRLQRRPEPLQFIGLGILVAAGLLSKYSFAIFLASLMVAGFSLAPFRRALLRPSLALAVLTAFLLLSPHLSWILHHSDQALAGLEKAETASSPSWQGVGRALGAGLAFLSPFWLVVLAILWPQRHQLKPANPEQAPGAALLQRLPLALVAILLIFVLASGATRFKDRWYLCLLFYAPLSAASLATPMSKRQQRLLRGVGIASATSAALLLPGRTLLGGITGKSSRPNYPLPQLVASVVADMPPPDLILASNGLLGGNARRVLPRVPVLTSQARHPAAASFHRILILVDRDDEPAELKNLLEQQLVNSAVKGVDVSLMKLQNKSMPNHWMPESNYTIRYAWVQVD